MPKKIKKEIRFPHPKKKITTQSELSDHIISLIGNALKWLEISGYRFHIFFKGDTEFNEDADAGMVIKVKYPYKIFNVSIQEETVASALKAPIDSPFWKNLERSVFHECIHIIIWRLSSIGEKRFITHSEIREEEENTVDHFTNVIHGLVEDTRIKKK